MLWVAKENAISMVHFKNARYGFGSAAVAVLAKATQNWLQGSQSKLLIPNLRWFSVSMVD